MKKILLLSLATAMLAATVLALPSGDSKKTRGTKATALDTDNYVNANRLLLICANNGAFAYDLASLLGKTDGLYFPFVSLDRIFSGDDDKTVVYASGLWIGATDSATAETLVTVAEYSQEFFPGNMIGGTADPAGLSNPAYRVYKLDGDSMASNPNQDYLDWPVSQGAPVDGSGDPALTGDQMTWCVYNDGDAASHTNDAGLTDPLGLEIQQSTFAFDKQDPLGNVVFLKFKILNKGSRTLTNTFVSLWSDPDLGGASDDLVGCDTMLSLGYCYNATNNDNAYGSRPPAVGYDFFQGPLEFTGNNADTAKMFGEVWPGYVNLPMASFNKYINGTDPHSYTESYNYMNGLDKDGNPDPNGTSFAVPGDPVTGTGDLDANPADRRFMLTTGPFTFRPGDSTEILAAIIVASGCDRLTSISALKYFDGFAQEAYKNDFQVKDAPAPPVVNVSEQKNLINLSWGTVSEDDPGDYPFEGYTIFQGKSPSGPWTKLGNYDLINGHTTIKDYVFDECAGVTNFIALKYGINSGIERDFEITQDVFTGARLVNYTPYYFRIEAYSVDVDDPFQNTLTSATIVTATPRPIVAEKDEPQPYSEVLPIDQTGISDGRVLATVVEPTELTGHTYMVKFDTLVSGDTVWNLFDETSGDTLIWQNTNISFDENYLVVDGFYLKVGRAGAGFKNFSVTANNCGPLNPPAGGAFDFQGFPSVQPEADYQQCTGSGRWGIHTADNGGSSDGGDRGSYEKFVDRTTRGGSLDAELGIYDYEVRFTGSPASPGVNGSWAYTAYATTTRAVWVPFELWNIGAGTLNDASDDYQMIAYLLDALDDSIFSLENYGSSGTGGSGGYEHSFSGGTNDPYTDWIYWQRPSNTTPGSAGYLQSEAELLAGTYDGSRETEVMARMVFGEWNGGTAPPFVMDMPEQGTIFRIETYKPIQLTDEWRFTPVVPTIASGNDRLKNVRAVPNPYYLYSEYDNSTLNRNIKFTYLPTKCTISIYTLTGERIRVLEKDSPESDMSWDVENSFGVPLASGVYLYVVEAPGMGQKVGKVAIFTEQEQLITY